MSKFDVLLVEDDERLRATFTAYLEEGGLTVVPETSYFGAMRQLERHEFLVVVADQAMPGPSGTSLLEVVRERWPNIGRVLFTGVDEDELTREAIRLSALLISKGDGSPVNWRRAIIAEVEDAERRHQSAV